MLALLLLPATEPPVAAADRPWNCTEVSLCTDRCGAQCPGGARKVPCLYDCRKRCRRQGCAGAKARFDAVTSCVIGRCLIPCGKGPTPACRACTLKHCGEKVGRCNLQQCP